jgi:tetratricopeptide (TPR) repeat protein
MFGVQIGWEPAASVLPLAERDALAAIRADEDDPWAHFALAMVYSYAGSIEDTLAEYELALRLNPNFALAQACYALVLTWVGRVREGAAAAGRAIRLSPRDPFSAIYYGVASYAAYAGRNYGESIRLGRESIRQRNDFVAAHRVITAAAGMTGDADLARSTLKEFRRLHPDVSLALVRSWLPVRDPAEREHFMEGLRRAGLE